MHPIATSPYTIVGSDNVGPFIFSCEHASNALPNFLTPTQRDQYFLNSHWGWDIGAKEVVEGLTHYFQSQAILCNFSRLLIDTNRSPDRGDIIRTETEGHSLSFNQNLSRMDTDRRFKEWYQPYHTAFDQLVASRVNDSSPVILVSVHSFTPVWDAQVRTMDIGVLFDHHVQPGERLAKYIEKEGFFVACNAPYTGKSGLMYSVEDKGLRHNCLSVELEINQSLICTPERIASVVQRLAPALQQWANNLTTP
jgi:predicted N-formylglutamate amidohydrolase